ncbi:hypothetical protein [Phytophthora cinnamomi ormycovirus 5-2]|uniref:Uncharacterized protein n=1 Tax=Phytophthora cinnamomi ormycovirus 5-2 TaxID=3239324 RepID=A0AB39JAX3_9VIRU
MSDVPKVIQTNSPSPAPEGNSRERSTLYPESQGLPQGLGKEMYRYDVVGPNNTGVTIVIGETGSTFLDLREFTAADMAKGPIRVGDNVTIESAKTLFVNRRYLLQLLAKNLQGENQEARKLHILANLLLWYTGGEAKLRMVEASFQRKDWDGAYMLLIVGQKMSMPHLSLNSAISGQNAQSVYNWGVIGEKCFFPNQESLADSRFWLLMYAIALELEIPVAETDEFDGFEWVSNENFMAVNSFGLKLFHRMNNLITSPQSATWRRGDRVDRDKNLIDGFVLYKRYLRLRSIYPDVELKKEFQDSIVFAREIRDKREVTKGLHLDFCLTRILENERCRKMVLFLLESIADRSDFLPSSIFVDPSTLYHRALRRGPKVTKQKGKRKVEENVLYSPFTFYHSKKKWESNPHLDPRIATLADRSNKLFQSIRVSNLKELNDVSSRIAPTLRYVYYLSDQIRDGKDKEQCLILAEEQIQKLGKTINSKEWGDLLSA